MKFKKVYVLCPIGLKTGGPELLHQLVYQINTIFGSNSAIIVYLGDGKKTKPVSEYQKYIHNKWITINEINDSADNVVVFPETSLSLYNNWINIKKYIWWLSVDNFLLTSSFKYNFKNFGPLHTCVHWLKGNIKNYSKIIRDADLNLCQSYYAENYLKMQGISQRKIVYLSDYINDLYVKDSKKALNISKKNIVLYNPKKGYKFTKKIISKSKSKNWKWIPLIGLKNSEVKKYLEISKVYIDFGNHPGKDRFPREAAISGCCVITDKRGAARYYNDIPIADEYKFNDTERYIPQIISKIKYCIDHYDVAVKDFDKYRSFIKSEKNDFKNEIINLFG